MISQEAKLLVTAAYLFLAIPIDGLLIMVYWNHFLPWPNLEFFQATALAIAVGLFTARYRARPKNEAKRKELAYKTVKFGFNVQVLAVFFWSALWIAKSFTEWI